MAEEGHGGQGHGASPSRVMILNAFLNGKVWTGCFQEPPPPMRDWKRFHEIQRPPFVVAHAEDSHLLLELFNMVIRHWP
jgi:hypothetical protein